MAGKLPVAGGFAYEPKWGGFRCIVFRDGDDVSPESRSDRALTRYFPEPVDTIRRERPVHCVLDGEVVIAGPSRLDFDALLQRVHTAESRVERLTWETPVSFVVFDLLADGDTDWRDRPFVERRAR